MKTHHPENERIKEEIKTEKRAEWLTQYILGQHEKFNERMKDYNGPSH